MNQLEKFILQSHIKIIALEDACGVGRGTIQHMADLHNSNGKKGRPLPPHHYPAIIRALCAPSGGVYIGGWLYQCGPDDPCVFATRVVKTLKVGVGGLNTQQVKVLFLSDLDLIEHFKQKF